MEKDRGKAPKAYPAWHIEAVMPDAKLVAEADSERPQE